MKTSKHLINNKQKKRGVRVVVSYLMYNVLYSI